MESTKKTNRLKEIGKALQDQGLDQKLTERVLASRGLARRLVREAQAWWGNWPEIYISDSQRMAAEIMGLNFIGIPEALDIPIMMPAQEEMQLLREVPYTPEILNRYAATHVLLPGFSISLGDIFADHPSCFARNYGADPAFVGNALAQTMVCPRWYLMRRNGVGVQCEDMVETSREALSPQEEVPRVCEVAFAEAVFRGARHDYFNNNRVKDTSIGIHCADGVISSLHDLDKLTIDEWDGWIKALATMVNPDVSSQ